MSLVQATIKLNQYGANTQSHFCHHVYESLLNVMRLVERYVFSKIFSFLLYYEKSHCEFLDVQGVQRYV